MLYKEYPVQVTERANCRRMRLTLHRGDSFFRLSVPPRTRQREVEQFLRSVEPWMASHAAQLGSWTPAFGAGERHLVLGRRVTLGADGVPAGSAFLRWRQRQLEQLVAALVPRWTQRAQLTPAVLRYRSMRSRWGSCQGKKGIITLSTQLALVPPAYVEQVYVHELCHLVHQDHSPVFHALLDSLVSDVIGEPWTTALCRKELKKYKLI